MRKIIYPILLSLLLIGCSDEYPDQGPQLEIRIEDSPADIKKVATIIDQIQVFKDGSWVDLDYQPRSISIMDYTGGETLLLVDQPIEPGLYSKVRFTFARQGTKVTLLSGEERVFGIPSGYDVVEIEINLEISDRKEYLLFDLDVAKSVDLVGKQYFPHLTLVDYYQMGAVAGNVVQAEGASAVEVMLIVFENEIGEQKATYTNPIRSNFFTRLAEGEYKLYIIPSSSSSFMPGELKEKVVVTKGELTNMGYLGLVIKDKPEITESGNNSPLDWCEIVKF